jgi:hypothetical protein
MTKAIARRTHVLLPYTNQADLSYESTMLIGAVARA